MSLSTMTNENYKYRTRKYFMRITSLKNILSISFSDRQIEVVYNILFNTQSKKAINNVFFSPSVKVLIEKINFTNIIFHFRLTNNLDVFNLRAYLFLLSEGMV